MATAESPLTRARSRVVSVRTFQVAAVVTLALLWLVIATGGLVRVTASGLGCPNWPTCEAGTLVPSASHHAVIEYTNRVLSGLAMVAAVVTAWMGFRTPGLSRAVAWGAFAAATGTVAQVPLGAVTVAVDLHPLAVMSHFLLALAVTAAAAWVTVHGIALARGRPLAPIERSKPALFAGLAVAAVLVLITTGAFVTAAGPHPGSTDKVIERFGDFSDAAYVHVRAAVTFAIIFAGLAVWLWRTARGTLTQRLSLAAVALTLCQIGIGEYQYRNGLPWGVVAVHVAIAGTLVITVVSVATLVAHRRIR
ncbi:MAG: heme a synthase [Gaiellales bacterium]|nr:heme a synthase [Gaiellales bacterium]